MRDPNRLNRVHVVNVRAKGDRFYVILSDSSVVEWEYWIAMTHEERRNQ
jgi:hypothetical protein